MAKITSCITSELDLFNDQNFQNVFRDASYNYYAANLNSPDICLIEVDKSDRFLDLSKSFLAFTVRVYKIVNDIEVVPTNEKISLANNFIATAFKQVQVSLDGEEIENSNTTYAIEDYIRRTLNETRDVKETYLQNHMYYADTPGQFNTFETSSSKTEEIKVEGGSKKITVPVESNFGFVKRHQRLIDGKGEVEIRGPVGSSFFHNGKLLFKQTKLNLTLKKNDDAFALLGDKSFKFKIVKCGLWVRSVIPNDEIVDAFNSQILSSQIFYNSVKTKVSIFNFLGTEKEYTTKLNQVDLIPNRLILCFNDYDALTSGSYDKNPFNFQHFGIRQISVRVNGSEYPYTNGIYFDFENNKSLDGYWTLFNGVQKPSFDSHIDLHAYKNGYFFLVLDLRHTDDCFEFKEINRSGSLYLTLTFDKNIQKSIGIVSYMEYNSRIIMEVNKDGTKKITK